MQNVRRFVQNVLLTLVLTLMYPASFLSAETSTAKTLTLQEANELAVKNNTLTLQAIENFKSSQADKTRAASIFYPSLSLTASQKRQTQNLASLGFSGFGGNFKSYIGPFNTFEMQLEMEQGIFSILAAKRLKAAKANVENSNLKMAEAQQQVVNNTALAYLEVLQNQHSLGAVKVSLGLAQSLLKLAQDQRDAGIATGVDVARAEAQLAAMQVEMAQAQMKLQSSRLKFQKTIGMPLNQDFTLGDDLHDTDEPLLSLNDAVLQAKKNRIELQIASGQMKTYNYLVQSANAEHLPAVALTAKYGLSGITPHENSLSVYSYGIKLQNPLFDGGKMKADAENARALLNKAEISLHDLESQIEMDVTLALQNISATKEEVHAAQKSLQLAEKELQMAQDRFASGVADNMDVVRAQAELANARQTLVQALTDYNKARISYYFFVGNIEKFRF